MGSERGNCVHALLACRAVRLKLNRDMECSASTLRQTGSFLHRAVVAELLCMIPSIQVYACAGWPCM